MSVSKNKFSSDQSVQWIDWNDGHKEGWQDAVLLLPVKGNKIIQSFGQNNYPHLHPKKCFIHNFPAPNVVKCSQLTGDSGISSNANCALLRVCVRRQGKINWHFIH